MKKTSIEIVKELKSHGYAAYWAGGSVRDLLLGREPKDIDIVTSANPDEIEDLLEKTIPIGKKFGVILAEKNGHHFEVATFRSDASYSDGRRPDAVYFTNPEDDAKRRDFTINGMFYDPLEKKVLDFVGGEKDLKDRMLRFIGNADERIKEDNLRILRAVRLKNSIGLSYSPETYEAVKNNAALIKNISKERTLDELNKILVSSGRVQAIRELDETGILEYLLPEVTALKHVKQPEKYHKEGDVYEHTLLALESLSDDNSLEIVWAVLLHDIGKPNTFSVQDRIRFNRHAEAGADMVKDIGKRLGFPKNFRLNVSWLVEHHMTTGNIIDMRRVRQAHWLNMPLFDELLALLYADIMGTEPQDLSMYNELKKLRDKKEKFLPKPERLLTGKDIIDEFGIESGPELGKLLDKVWHAQMEEEISTKEEAINFVRKLIEKDSKKK